VAAALHRCAAVDNAAVNDTRSIAVIDFETTGMSPALGARATEVAVVLLREGRVVGRHASLMRSGERVPRFIEQLTGISNRMLSAAPPAAEVMAQAAEWTRGCDLVAHNASFDRAFWQAERRLAGLHSPPPGADAAVAGRVDNEVQATEFACTLLLSRRLYPEAPNHKLGTLAAWHGIAAAGRAHRALADAEVTAGLWLCITRDVQRRYAAQTPFGLLCALQRAPHAALAQCVERYFAAAPHAGRLSSLPAVGPG
jgi:DNA polymerase-3 subunit epsilon